MDSNNHSLITNEYDDGVVCFGPVTEDQINRYKRLPRRTVLPSDFELSQSVFESDKDKKNDKSIVLDVSNENTTCYDNSVNITQSLNNFDEDKEEIGTLELKQSISEDSNSRFSSPCSSKCIPNAKLIDTEVINRYIRMGSISSNESSLSEIQNKSTFEDETISFTDPQESELIQNNYDYNETSLCEHLSVSSIIEQSPSINQQNMLDDSNNVCTLIHCSQEDDTDLSICSDIELGDVSEDSICTDEYSITPGKQRLFDLRVTKQSLRVKTLKASAPFMDRIEETTTPVLAKVINAPFILNDNSNIHSETKKGFNGSSITDISHETSTEHFNQTSNENVFEITKLIEETTGELLVSNNLKVTNFLNECAGTKFDEVTNNRSMDSNQSLNETVHIPSILNDTESKIDNEISMNTMSNMANPTCDVNDYNDEEYSVPMEVDIKSSNTSVVGTVVDETMCTIEFPTNDQNMSLNKSLNDTKQEFDDGKSMKTSFNMANPTCDVNDYNDEEYSVPMEVDIKSPNTSVVGTVVDETMYISKLPTNNQSISLNKSLNVTEQKFDEKSICIMSNVTISQGISTPGVYDHYNEGNSINMNIADKVFDETMDSNRLSTNNQSTDLNKSLNKTNHIENILNDSEHKFDDEKSMNTISNTANSTPDINDEEYSVPIQVVDTIVDETMYTSKLPTNDQSMSLNKSLNVTEQKFDEKSICIISNVTISQGISTPGVYDHYNEVNSINMNIADKVFDETMDSNRLSTNNQSTDLNKSLNKTNHIENILNDSEHKFDDEKSMNTISNTANSTPDINDEEYSVPIQVVDTIVDETMYTSKLPTNNQSMSLNKSLNVTEQKFDEKSICIISNVTISQGISTPGVYDHYNEVNSINMNIADKVFDETMDSNRLSTNNQSTDLNKSLNKTNHIENILNDSEHKFDDEKSMNTISNTANSTPNINDEEYSVPIQVVDTIVDETMYTSKFSTNDQSMHLNKFLNDTKQQFDNEMSECIISNVTVPQGISTSSVNDYYAEENLINTSREDKVFDETVYANRLSANNQSTDSNKSLNNTNHIEGTINDSEHKFNNEKLMNSTSNVANSTPDVNDYNNEEYSVPIEVDIKSSNTSVQDTRNDETMCTNKLSANNQSMDLNKSFNRTNRVESILSDTEHKFDNDEEYSAPIEVDIKSSNTSVVDTIVGKTMYTIKLLTDNQNMNLNKSLNDTKQKFDDEEPINTTTFNIDNPTPDDNVYNDEYSMPMEVDIKSPNTSIVGTIVDETMYTSKLPTNDQSMNLNKSLNDTKQQFDDEKSICIMSNITISEAMSTSDVNYHYNEGNSINMTITDKVFDETIYTNRLSTNNQSMNLDKSLNKTNHIENILNGSEHKFDDEKSMDSMSNMANPTSDVNDFNNEEYSVPMKVDINSSNTSVMDTKIYETMCLNKLPTNNSGINFKESINDTISTSNDTEHGLINNIQNTTVLAIHLEEKLHTSKLNKSILKNTTISDDSFVESNEVNITCNTTLVDPSCMMRQYLDFEQAVNEICEDITSVRCPSKKLNVPKASYDDETLERLIEQTLSSDKFDSTKINENVSNYDGSNLSVIIENTTLETSSNNIEEIEDILNSNTDIPIISESESIVNEIKNNELLNTSAVVNTVESTVVSKFEMGILNEKSIQIKTKANESISMNCIITDSGLVENINAAKNNESSVIGDELSEMDTFNKMDKQLDNITTKQLLVPENINEKIHSNQIINSTDISNFTAFKLISETEKTDKNFFDQDNINDNQQDSLDISKSNNNSLEEFTNLEQMFNFGDNQKEKQVEYKTPKIQKLLDFSIIQQTPTFDNQAKKQKLLNFSIVDQTPLKSAQQTYPNKNIINSDSLINFSSIDQMWNSEIVPNDKIIYRDFQNSSSNNLSSISSPDVELLADESIKINTSQFSNSSFNQTITDSNLNLSTYSCTSNNTQNNIIELENVEPVVLVNKQGLVDSLSNSLNQTIKQDESVQKKIFNKHCMLEESTNEVKLLSNITLNKTIDSAEITGDSNHTLCTDSNKDSIVDFSIIDKGLMENFDLKNNTDVISVDSDKKFSNLIEMSLVSIPVNNSDELSVILSDNSIEVKTSDNGSKTSIGSSSNEINSTTLQFEESTFLHNNTELLTDIQMNDESLLTETPEKSSIIDSFHSIELDHVQEDNKRKIDTIQEDDSSEKKMKVETETLKTPMSMLYKIKNMFRSSEKQLSCVNNTKENNLKLGKCYQKLNFGKFEENNDNFTKPTSLKISEVPIKSKIPCKVTDRSSKNDEFNNSSLSSLNDSIKQKKTIPKFSGVPVLSDVSNSSNRKCTESRIPSKFQK